MKSYKRSLMLLSVAFLFSIAACNKSENTSSPSGNSVTNTNSTSDYKMDLPLVLTDKTVSQESQLNRIKADLLKVNNGYQDEDIVTCIVKLNENALIDTYLNGENNVYYKVSDYANSAKGYNQRENIKDNQINLIKELKDLGYLLSVEHQYNTILNAVAIKTHYKNVAKIGELANVSMVSLSETYNAPQTTTGGNYNAVINNVDVWESTGIFKNPLAESGIDGSGTSVAILDSGYQISHEVFENQPTRVALTKSDIENTIKKSGFNASTTTLGLKVDDVYYSAKIPFKYDYADKDYDVDPSDSNHGTHVAGIIGGKSERITGIATNTQLVLMKVFPDVGDGADAEDILAGLEDAVLLGVDAINMSLGASCGFSREADEEEINRVYDAIDQTGISVVVAASNSYSSAYGGTQGNTNKVTNPDSSTVGSPSTYPTSLSVASISGMKSRYIKANDNQIFFFNESNNVTGEQNDFITELYTALGKDPNSTEDVEIEYVTVPGSGIRANYSSIDVKGKIALVRRGDNTFEEKAQIAKSRGAIACIIYNNVAGEIIMSMGKSDHIPTISISKADGTILAAKKSGKLVFNATNQAGPFMSNFSSWGPNPDLSLKPEITAHGGNIISSVPGNDYDKLSGTSMACPNMCGAVVLIRQALKDNPKYEGYNAKQITTLTYQLLMSTATIANNEDGNPYSPRKQGAGLADITAATQTQGYITVDGLDRTKLELGDDKARSGVYEMEFNVVNSGDSKLSYNLGIKAMTESLDSSNKEFVAEKPYMLNSNVDVTVNGVKQETSLIEVEGNQTVSVKVVYTLTDAEKKYLNDSFPYGMYVEGFVTLTPTDSNPYDLNIPFLAFYGDWTQAPMFDKTYFEVESEAHNQAIDEDDKIKADYYATTPYGTYYASYIIPLGSYLYDIDLSKYEAIPATEEHIAITNTMGAIDGISQVYAGLLRNAKEMKFTITDVETGEVVYEYYDYNAHKSYSNGSSPIPYYEQLTVKALDEQFVNNKQYRFKMEGKLDYEDGGVNTNERNSFEFTFYMDDEAPLLTNAQFEKEYDKGEKKDRYYITLDVYDNHYVQSISPIIFTSDNSYATLEKNPVPVYGQRNSTTSVRFEITDYLDKLYSDEVLTSALGFAIDDYALNTNIYYVQLPGTTGDLKFTENGLFDGPNMTVASATVGKVTDLIPYLASNDPLMGDSKEYLRNLVWESSNTNVAVVNEGKIRGLKAGRCKITVTDRMMGKSASITVLVEDDVASTVRLLSDTTVISDVDVNSCRLEKLEFVYFDTLYAHKAAGQTSLIGETGERIYVSNAKSINCYPGESVKMTYNVEPWYLPSERYSVKYSSSNESVARVEQDGTITALAEGNCTIKLNITVDGRQSTIMASIAVNVKNPFIIENRMLVAYKGIGGDVVIPENEGIGQIAAYAFSLYEIDKQIVLDEDDYDKNKIPGGNSTITSITIPKGVQTIEKYAFYNLTNLKSVKLPDSLDFIRPYAFSGCSSLTDINLDIVQVIGKDAFKGCSSLNNINIPKCYTIGPEAFRGCTSLTSIDLTTVRNCGIYAFADCANLSQVVLTKDSKLSVGMFMNSGLTEVTVNEDRIPDQCFKDCKKLTNVTITQDLVYIGSEAFMGCSNLTNVTMNNCKIIYSSAFKNCSSLQTITLPNEEFSLGASAFSGCSALQTVIMQPNTLIKDMNELTFSGTNVNFDTTNSLYYTYENGILYNKDKTEIIYVTDNFNEEVYTIPSTVTKINSGAFSGCSVIKEVVINSNIEIQEYAFSNCSNLTKVTLPANTNIPDYAFDGCVKLNEVINLDSATSIGKYAFSKTALIDVTLAATEILDSAFEASKVQIVTLKNPSTIGIQAFKDCTSLTTVNMPSVAGVNILDSAFENCTALQTIDLSKAINKIGDKAFKGCIRITAANLENILVVGNEAFMGCMAITELNLVNVTNILDRAFTSYNANAAIAVTSLEFGPNLEEIGVQAFGFLPNLITVTMQNNVVTLKEKAFSYCYKLESVQLSSGIKTISKEAFRECQKLNTINLENVEVIEEQAFILNTSLTNINLNSIKTLGFGAFASCNKLANVNNTNNLVSLGAYALQGTLISNINLDSCTEILESALSSCPNLTEVVLSENIKKVDTYAFNLSKNFKTFSFMKNGEKVNDGSINEYALLDNGILYTYLKSGNLQLTCVPQGMEIETLNVLDGTIRIDIFAAANNKSIQKIVLTDTLKTIGNYAFYGDTNLKEVEFRSFTAPTLETFYVANSTVLQTDPGYDTLNKYFNVIAIELYYYHFINLVGKNEPIKMILPINEGVIGYDSIIYETYFGKVSDATRSDYECKDNTTLLFLDSIKTIPSNVTLADDSVITTCLTYYNALTQDLTKFGYTKAEVDEMFNTITTASKALNALKREEARAEVRNVQALIDSMPTVFKLSDLEKLNTIYKRLYRLSIAERNILDLTNYNILVESYNEYLKTLNQESGQVNTIVNNSYNTTAAQVVALTSSIGLLAYVLKRKFF